ncbi:MAG: hypothetical protein ACTH8F_09695 [Microbacterium sp.]|uniref:hypothetical protein n=1 Tax=Microbacterium sp. TaxID=51671 RepID=UPI003F94422A
MNIDPLTTRQAAVLECLNPRRMRLLLQAAALGGEVTAPELHQALRDIPVRTISTDMNVLEHAGLVRANPPIGQPRRGRIPVHYRVSPDVPAVFQQLTTLVHDAWLTRPSSAT